MDNDFKVVLFRILIISISTAFLIVTKISTPVEAYLLSIMFWLMQISYDINRGN